MSNARPAKQPVERMQHAPVVPRDNTKIKTVHERGMVVKVAVWVRMAIRTAKPLRLRVKIALLGGGHPLWVMVLVPTLWLALLVTKVVTMPNWGKTVTVLVSNVKKDLTAMKNLWPLVNIALPANPTLHKVLLRPMLVNSVPKALSFVQRQPVVSRALGPRTKIKTMRRLSLVLCGLRAVLAKK